jgi:hypothetical protein
MLESEKGLKAWWHEMSVHKQGGPDAGARLVIAFESEEEITEEWTVTRICEHQSVIYSVEFVGFGTVERRLSLTPGAGETLVVWYQTGTFDSPITPELREQTLANFGMALTMLGAAAQKYRG